MNWRLLAIFPIVFVGLCLGLFLSVIAELLGDMHHALFSAMMFLVEWAGVKSAALSHQEVE